MFDYLFPKFFAAGDQPPAIHIIDYSRNRTKLVEYGEVKSFFRASGVLLLRIGFIMIQVGCIPTMCVYTVVFYNILDIVITIICFTFIGYMVAFGRDAGGIIGTKIFISSTAADLDEAVHGICACIIGSAIVTTLTADRVHMACFVIITIFNSALFLPMLMHWAWEMDGWLARNRLMSYRVSFKDQGGSLIIHFASGMIGLIAASFLGRRLIQLNMVHECSVTRSSVIIVPLGYAFIMLGLIGFPLTTPIYQERHLHFNAIAIIFINQMLALAAGMLVILLMQLAFRTRSFDYWKVLRIMQGGVAGLVCVAAGVDVYSPVGAFFVAVFVTVIVYFFLVIIFRSSIEDYCNIAAVHVVSGSLGILAPALFAVREHMGVHVAFHTSLIHFTWQFVGLIVVSATVVIVFLILYAIFSCYNCLRNKTEAENHARSEEVERIKRRKLCCEALCDPDENVPYFEPGISRRIQVPGKNGRLIGEFVSYKTNTSGETPPLKNKKDSKKSRQPRKSGGPRSPRGNRQI